MAGNQHSESSNKKSPRDDSHAEKCHASHDNRTGPNELDVTNPNVIYCLELMRRVWPADQSKNEPRIAAEAEHPQEAHLATEWGRFVLRHRIGQGTYGVVFRAFDTLLKREVAVKIPQPHVLGNSSSLKRFLREAEAAATLEHAGIVRVFDVGEINGVAFIVSELCDGPNLAQWLTENRSSIAAETAVAIIMQVAAALDHAHCRGVLHRDLKPSNIVLSKVDSGNADFPFSVRISDFGLAKVAGAASLGTIDGALLGTLRYMSPEQASGRIRDVGVQSDVWALGALLYELLAGKPAFEGEDVSVLHKIQEQSPVHLASLGRAIPADLVNICHCALQKELAHRYKSAEEMLADLRRFDRGEPVSARPLGRAARATRWMRRRPLVASLAVALLIVGGLGLMGVITQWRRADHEAITARQEAARAEAHLIEAQASLRDLACMVQELGLHSHPDDHHLRGVARLMAIHLDKGEQESLEGKSRRASFAAGRMFSANMAALAGDHNGALADFDRGVSAWQQIVREESANRHYRRALALALYCHGVSLDECGQPAEAKKRFEAAREVLLPVSDDIHATTAGLLEYTEMVSNLGRSFDLRRRAEHAKAAFAEASLVSFRAHALNLSDEAVSLCAASMAAQLAKHLAKTRDRPRALTEYENARDLVRQITAANRCNEVAQDLIVRIDQARAQLYRRNGKWQEASLAYADAIRGAEAGLGQFANDKAWRSLLANLCYEFGLSKLERKELPGAEFVLAKANDHWTLLSNCQRISDADMAKWGVISCELAGIYQVTNKLKLAIDAAERAARLLTATQGIVSATPKLRRARQTSVAMLAALRGETQGVPPSQWLEAADEDLELLE